MKKILFLLSLIVLSLSLFGCKETYEPQKSTDEESRVMFTLELDRKRYDVKYELYRALFLNNKAYVDGGESEVWQGENKEEYIEKINGIILKSASDIFSAIHTADKLGYNVYSKDADKKVTEYIRLSVEGNGADLLGYESYEKYLESLKMRNLNYSVSDLLIRYSLALEAINEYYLGREDALGDSSSDISFTEENVKEYYYSDECRRVLRAFIGEGVRTKDEVMALREQLASAESPTAVALLIIQNTATTATDLLDENDEVSGIVIGKNELDEIYYSNYINQIFETEVGETSEVVEINSVNDGTSDGYYIIYGLEKNDAHFEAHYETIAQSYIGNEIGRVLKNNAKTLSENAKFTERYNTIEHYRISME